MDNKIFILIILIIFLWLYKNLSKSDINYVKRSGTSTDKKVSGITTKDQSMIKNERGGLAWQNYTCC